MRASKLSLAYTLPAASSVISLHRPPVRPSRCGGKVVAHALGAGIRIDADPRRRQVGAVRAVADPEQVVGARHRHVDGAESQAPGGAPSSGASDPAAALAGHHLLVPRRRARDAPRGAPPLPRPRRPRCPSHQQPAPLVEAATLGHGIVPVADFWAQLAGLTRVAALPHIAPRPLWLAVAPVSRERPAVRAVADELARLASDRA
jgi:hypothetical protein